MLNSFKVNVAHGFAALQIFVKALELEKYIGNISVCSFVSKRCNACINTILISLLYDKAIL